MKLIVVLMLALLICAPAFAQQAIVPCVQIPGTPYPSCQPVTIANPLPVLIIGE